MQTETDITLLSRKCSNWPCFFHSGGYDRGECLDTVSVYDPSTNEWRSADKMITKRGRFDATVIGNDVLFAVAGSNGTSELTSAEKYDRRTGRWTSIASLPVPVSNIGECARFKFKYCQLASSFPIPTRG